jgi:hypothetical protein
MLLALHQLIETILMPTHGMGLIFQLDTLNIIKSQVMIYSLTKHASPENEIPIILIQIDLISFDVHIFLVRDNTFPYFQ